jgi:glycosyltransferase involved in cell wall biosynthesis
MPHVSAYIPCYNNAEYLPECLESVRSQSVPVDQIFVVDDASTDGSAKVAESLGIKVIELSQHSGRGAVRAKAMEVADNEFVLCCDSSKSLDTGFLERALTWFDNDKVAAVFGSINQVSASTVADRWRGRHLFKMGASHEASRNGSLISAGMLCKKSAVMAVGNYARNCSHSEDKELGSRLLNAGYEVIFDPQLQVFSLSADSPLEVLDRYWRWHAGTDEKADLTSYLRQIWYSLRVMAVEDLKSNDPAASLLSLASPHYQFWKSWSRRR